jgi:hypothetical protein
LHAILVQALSNIFPRASSGILYHELAMAYLCHSMWHTTSLVTGNTTQKSNEDFQQKKALAVASAFRIEWGDLKQQSLAPIAGEP